MSENESKIVDVYFLSSSSAGKTSILNRMLFNSYNSLTTKKEIKYHKLNKLHLNENYMTFNFFNIKDKNSFKNYFNSEKENIFIFVYNLNNSDNINSLNPLIEEIKSYIKETPNNFKIGIVGNKLDLISKNKIKEVKNIGEKFARKVGGTHFLTSAKTGKGDVFQFIIDILEMESKNEIIKIKKNIIKEYIQLNKNNNILNNIIRCENCKIKIVEINFHDQSNKIELSCSNEPQKTYIYGFKQIMALIIKQCELFKTEFEEKNTDLLIYCKKCKIIICNKCVKKHNHNSEEDLINPYFAEDQLCSAHGIKNELCCMNCKSLICNFCYNNYHKGHDITKVNDNFINEIIINKQKLLNKAEKQLEQFKNFYDNLIRELSLLYYDYLDKINVVLTIKKNALNQFEVMKYNNELYKTVTNMKFDELERDLQINKNLSIIDKLTIFFDYIEQSININKYNICNGDKIVKQYNLDIKVKTTLNNNDNYSSKITDVCKINKDYFCISFLNGTIKIYNGNDMDADPKIYELFEVKKGVNSLINYNNENTLFASGYGKIYQLKVNPDLSIDKICIINDENQNINYIKLYNFNDRKSILFSDNLGNLGIYDLNKKTKSNIKFSNNDNLEMIIILDINNINENIFYIRYGYYELI